MISEAAHYTLAITIELQRRSLAGATTDLSSLPEDKKKRILELSAYFTIPALEPSHVTLALWTAMNLANKNRQYSSALSFANSMIEKGTNHKFKETVGQEPSCLTTSMWLTTLAGAKSKDDLRA